MRDTGDPSTLAPELCVEILSASNTDDELREKRALYREIGAEEVWVVDPDGRIRFFAETERDASALAPSCPDRVDPTA
jgi:Uma2 family endonuclease